MRNHKIYGRALSCQGKVKLDSEIEAKHQIKQTHRVRDFLGKARIVLGYYHCQYCDKWHMGRQDDKVREKSAKIRHKRKAMAMTIDEHDEIKELLEKDTNEAQKTQEPKID